MKSSAIQERTLEVIRRFPKHGTRTIARALYKENPKLFRNVEHARNRVRYYRGEAGDAQRQKARAHGLVKSKPKQAPWNEFPEGIKQIKDWSSIQLECRRALVISDLHIPFHDKAAIVACLKYGQEFKPDLILINGDFMDFFSLSHWQTDPRLRDLANELEAGRAGLAMIRKTFPKARILFKKGNHEEWLERYYATRAPELLGVSDFEIEHLLRFSEYGIEKTPDLRTLRIGALNIVHGHEFGKATFGAPVNAARGLYLRAKNTSLCGHWHQTAEHTERDIEDSTKTAWAAGCLCDLHPRFAPHNRWNHGLATVELDSDGHNFRLENKKILKGRVF